MAINRLDGQLPPERPEGLRNGAGRTAETPTSRSGGDRLSGRETAASDGDRVELSREARQIAELRKTVAGLPDVREARVAELREALSRGTYRVESRELAQAILKDPDAVAGE